jgi:predicted MFS family arabinose efflux permease
VIQLRRLGRLEGLRSLRHRNYRLYWTGQLISLIGTQMQQVAQAWLVLTLTDDPLMLGLLAAAQWGPILLFGLFGGVIADALPKRRVILTTQTIAMALAFILVALTVTGTIQVWQVLLMAVLLGFTQVVDLPTRQSFMYEMVGRDDLPNAIALNSAINNGAKVLGPAVAGLTIAAVGVEAAFVLNGLSFLAVIACLLSMRTAELMPSVRSALPRTVGGIVNGVGEGLGYIRRTRHVLIAITVLGVVATAAMNYPVLMPPLARDVLNAGPSGFGFLMSAAGIGSLVAAVAIAFRLRPSTRTILAGALMLGVLEAALASSRWMPLSLACMFGMGFGGLMMSMSTQTVLQIDVPDQLRGRVMAVFTTVFAGSNPIGGLIAGAIAGAFGTPIAILVAGLVAASVALVAGVVAWRWGLLGPVRPDLARARS